MSDAQEPISPQRGEGAEPGTVYLVGAGPGDAELLTLRGLALLASADVILHDELAPRALLTRAKPGAVIECVGKRGARPAEKQRKQSEIDALIIAHAKAGRSVVRLKGGDPYMFGRGSEEAEAVVREGLAFEVVPGVTSPLAAAAYAGISLTHRDLASSVVFVSAATRDGLGFDFRELAGHRGTIAVFMGLGRIEQVCSALIEHALRAPTTPAATVSAATRPDQFVVTGTLADLPARVAEAGQRARSPALVIIGEVVRLREHLRWFDVQPLFGHGVLVARAEHQSGQAARLLRRRGAAVHEISLLEMMDPPDPALVQRAVRELHHYDVVAFTSENSVTRFLSAVRSQGRDARAFAHAKLACVGESTARTLLSWGLEADIVPTSFRGEALAEAILANGTPRRVLLPRALVARESLPEMLRASGAVVDVVPVYETRRVSSPERRQELRQALETKAIDVVLLTSSSTADAFADLLGEASLEGVLLASIGEVTTATARARGLDVTLTAPTSTLLGLIEAVEQFLQKRP